MTLMTSTISLTGDFCEEAPDGLVCLEPFHAAEDIVLYHAQRQPCDLPREVDALAFPKVKQALHLLMSHLYNPSSGVKFESFSGIDARICGYEGVPGAIALPVVEQHHVHSGIAGLDGCVMVSDGTGILDSLGFHKLIDDVRGGKLADGTVVFGLSHLDHTDEIALEVTAVDELEQFRAGEPTVNKEIVEADALHDGPAYHLDCVRNFALRHFGLSGVYLFVLGAFFCVLCSLLLFGKPLWPLLVLAGLCLYGVVKHKLSFAVSVAQEHGLEAENALHSSVGEHFPEALGLHSAFRKVGIVNDETTNGILGVSPAADFADKLAVDGIYEASPVDAPVIHKTVEHILLAGEKLAESAVRIIGSILHGEEREQDEQFHHLDEGELAVRILNRTDHFGLYGEAIHHCCYALYCLAGIIVFEKALEFADYLSIFVHG